MTRTPSALSTSRALWNRSELDLRSLETLAQILDRGELQAWRELAELCLEDGALRARVRRVVLSVPLAYGHFWLAALANMGEPVELDAELPRDPGGT